MRCSTPPRPLRLSFLRILLRAALHSFLVVIAATNAANENVRETNRVVEIDVHGEQQRNENGETTASTTTLMVVDHGYELMEWMKREEGAYLHPNLIVRRTGANETSPYFGMFAIGPIQADELMIEIPRSMVFHPDPPTVGDRVVAYFDDGEYTGTVKKVKVDEDDNDTLYDVLFDDDTHIHRNVDGDIVTHEDYPSCCATVYKLIREMKLGNDSRFAPYVNYLLTQPSGQLPTSWSKAGQTLLLEVLGRKTSSPPPNKDEEDDEDEESHQQILPPFGTFGWIEDDWHARCKGGNDPLSESAYMLLAQRGWDEVMIPVFDMMSHRNGHYLNTDHDPIRDGESVKVRASRNIVEGEEIYTSYNFCTDCQARIHNYGTPELLRDYGFVEDYPQRWVLERMRFDLDYQRNEQGEPIGDLEVKWKGLKPSHYGINFLQTQLQRLETLSEMELQVRDPRIPEHEWNVITQFVQSMRTAFQYAIRSVSPDKEETECTKQDGSCGVLGGGAAANRYSLLEPEMEKWGDERPSTCDTKNIYAFDEWETIETIQSPYQRMSFATVPALNDDMCFDLDDIVQICASYRPHYHEVMVHYPARFLESVRRILFVGGGDSMLLHEALKYPSLELVVGLELDQVVTRHSFQYFGTQPHWDDPRVEWWYGDATKSLTMLPSEYFGSFDLVLVDLSETVQALSVTDELDVLHALALLVKPNGILVQNEYTHFPEQASVFQHALHVHYYDVPIVCSQSLILASNGIDFMQGPLRDHNVNILYDRLNEENIRYDIIRDYQLNVTNPNNCHKPTESKTPSKTQERSPGILMILEVEGTIDLSDSETVRDKLSKAVQDLGLNLISSSVTQTSAKRSVVSVILKEGYIVARTWPDLKYCAFDIHFWSHFDKQDIAKKSLVEAVRASGSKSVASSYRIVAGGVFGCEKWRDDQMTRGPQLSNLCSPPVDLKGDKTRTPPQPHVLTSLIQESLNFVDENDYVIAVLCGTEQDKCQSYQALRNSDAAKLILPLSPCVGLGEDLTLEKDGAERMLTCEKELIGILHNELAGKRIRAIALDPSAPFSLTQIVTRIFATSFNAQRWLATDILVEALVVDKSAWRREFAHRFRKETHQEEPVFTTDVSFQDAEHEATVVLTSSGDSHFPRRLIEFTQRVQENTGLVPTIDAIRAGLFTYQYDFEPAQVFTHEHYDQDEALYQWRNQQPLGLQTVLQLETKSKLPVSKAVFEDGIRLSLKGADTDVDLQAKDLHTASIGEGHIVTATWAGGNVVALWDGKLHVDVNLFTYRDGLAFADKFESSFLARIKPLKTVLRDEQPRGTGGVVSLETSTDDPIWS